MTAAVLLTAALGCGLPEGDYFGTVALHPDPTHLRWCNSGEPDGIDPALVTSTTGVPIANAVFDGLTRIDMNGLPEPSLALRWDIAPDLRRFTFHLRDDARWSNGRALDARDMAYALTRVLHPFTNSPKAETLWKLKNGELYTANRVRLVLHDRGELRAGDIVELLGANGEVAADATKISLPDSNDRTASAELALRDLGADVQAAYARVPRGTVVRLVERGEHDGVPWAYVLWNTGDGVLGWVPASELDGQPNAAAVYTVRRVGRDSWPGYDLDAASFAGEVARGVGAASGDLAAVHTAYFAAARLARSSALLAGDGLGRLAAIAAAAAVVTPAAAAPFAVTTALGEDLLLVPDVLGLRIPDHHTVVFETSAPVPYLIAESPQQVFRPTPREAVSRWPRRWTKPEHIISSGAFHLTEWRERDYQRMVKSPSYWDRENVRLETFTSFSMNDQAASANYYYYGGCDAIVANNVPASYMPALNGDLRGGRAYRDFANIPYLGAYFYLINSKRHTNVHFRRALAFAVDRSQIPRFLHGGQIASAQYVPGMPIRDLSEPDLAACGVDRDHPGVASVMETGALCYVPPPGLDFDPERARQEFAQARAELGGKMPSRITVKFNSGIEQHKLIAEYLQRQWQDVLGLGVDLEVQEWKTFLADTRNGEYDVARMGWIGNFPDAEAEFLGIFRCTNPDNKAQYCSDDFERYMDLAKGTIDRKQRLKWVYEAERTMVEDAPIVPLYVYSQQHLQKPYVRDLAINLPNQVPFNRVWIEPDWRGNPKPLLPGQRVPAGGATGPIELPGPEGTP